MKKFDIKEFLIKHKIIAISIPVGIIFIYLLIVMSFPSTESGQNFNEDKSTGFNQELPYDKKELEVKGPNDYYTEGIKDSILDSYRGKGGMKSIGSESDSSSKTVLDSIAKSLEDFSFDDKEKETRIQPLATNRGETRNSSNNINLSTSTSNYISEKDKEKVVDMNEVLKYANKKSTSTSELENDNSSFTSSKGKGQNITLSSVSALVVKETIINSDGQRIQLVLSEDLRIGNKLILKGKKFYGFVKYTEHRILIDVRSIAGINASFKVLDPDDLSEGIHIKGGSLIRDIKGSASDALIDEGARLSDSRFLRDAGEIVKRDNRRNLKPVLINMNQPLKISYNQ